jgi:anti-anti-sigma factor
MPRTAKKKTKAGSTSASVNNVVLEGELTINQVGQIKPVLLKALSAAQAGDKTVRLDMSALSECDGAGLQLLLSLAVTARVLDTSIQLMNPPNNVVAIFDSFGVRKYFSHAQPEAA